MAYMALNKAICIIHKLASYDLSHNAGMRIHQAMHTTTSSARICTNTPNWARALTLIIYAHLNAHAHMALFIPCTKRGDRWGHSRTPSRYHSKRKHAHIDISFPKDKRAHVRIHTRTYRSSHARGYFSRYSYYCHGSGALNTHAQNLQLTDQCMHTTTVRAQELGYDIYAYTLWSCQSNRLPDGSHVHA